ncbi:MAG: kinase [Terricaulis sp.]
MSPTPGPSPASRGEGEIATLIFNVIQDVRARHPDRPPALIGVSGAQGCGKTHVCALLEAANRPRFAHFSLDDVYLTKAERIWRADNISSFTATRDQDGKFDVGHVARPMIEQLLLVRGPPGTHDLSFAQRLIAQLGQAKPTALPRFDKVIDDRAPESEWPTFNGPAEAILIDGWCLGAAPVAFREPINDVERDDIGGIWRRETEMQLRKKYIRFFASFDAIVYLQAPNWKIVRKWRGQQEEQTLGRKLTAEEDAKLDRFLMFYERITKSMMAGNHSATHVVKLDERRQPL